jgi:uncharacterized repeat protein (TIGR01451 family)
MAVLLVNAASSCAPGRPPRKLRSFVQSWEANMAAKLRLATKLFLATSVLAGGGAGAYYGTTVGWPAMLRTGSDAVLDTHSPPETNNAQFDAGDLDAVAGAWAQPAADQASARPHATTTPRDADAVLARLESATAAADRYALATASSSNASQQPVPKREPQQTVEAQPLPAEPALAPPAGDIAANTTGDESAATPAVARGQEPNDETPPDETPPLEAAEPQPLPEAGAAAKIDSDNPQVSAEARNRNSAADSDRYGSATMREPAVVNPFGTKEPTAPAREAEADAAQTVQPLPALQDEIGGQLRELQQSGGSVKGSPRSERTARATPGNPPEDMFPAGPPQSSNDIFKADAGATTPPAGPLPDAPPRQAGAIDGKGRPGERALEGAQRPALEIQKFAPAEIQVGKPAKFVLQIRNVGSQAAEGVVVRDEVPQGTRLISASPDAQNDGHTLLWELGRLSTGEDRTVEVQLMPTAEGEIGSVATVSCSAQASVKTRCTMPQLAIRMTAPSEVMIGQEQRVKIELRNPGSGDATGVMLFENVPQNVRHAAGPTLEFEVGTLRAGETRELELVLFAEKAGKTVNVLSARADGNLQVQQQVEFEVIAPELTVDVSGPERRYLERPATYEVSVENPGTAPAHDVQIITKLPKGLRFVRANNMGEYDAATHAVYWSLAELPEGERGTVELVAMPVETGAQTLEVESRTGEGLSDQAERQIVVDGLAAILFELHDLEDPIEVGGETGYEIRVANQGTKAAANVQVTVNLPTGMQLVSAEGETQHTAQHGTVAFDPISELAPKADTLYRVRVKGMQAGDQRVTVEVNTDDVAQPIRREESTRVFGDE